tara:strand:- start:451 stop:693 length:243 start_codon:yes stop_codon:yes gene_type:complete
MKLKQIGSNQTELIFNDGTEVLFSYETPVAVLTVNGMYVTETKYSSTTSRHINKWCEGITRTTIPQDNIDTLVKRGGKSG